MFKKSSKFIQLGSLSDNWTWGKRTVLFNAMNISVQWCLYITVLKKNSTKKTRSIHHFLQPGGTSNGKNICTLLTARLNCPVKEEVSIKANTQCILPQRQQTRRDLKENAISPQLMRASHIRPPLSFLTTNLPVATVKEQ